jgi:serine/threonine protein kinase/tetratricopeptide (TPR) repeat protein
MPEVSLPQESIFAAALELPLADRAAFLDRACACDIALRAEVESLLRAHNRTGDLLNLTAEQVAARDGNGAILPQIPGYDVLAELGQGGMGIVYRVHDRRRREVLALKVMRHFDAAALYRFKQEFRTLADLSHHNLVALYDLVGDESHWFFTMEFVEGVNFLTHVRAGGAGEVAQATGPLPATVSAELAGSTAAGSATPLTAVQQERLRAALRQLACGVSALHAAGKLHRDIKPSNVLVTPAGRVVLLDFGLAVELSPTGADRAPGEVAGTAAYMAPEQAAGLSLSPACDWYAVGVMLYQALTGRLPFTGSVLDVLQAKQCAEPPAPGDIVEGVPPDLHGLCAELIRRDPAGRPVGSEVLRRLGVAPGAEAAVPHAAPEERLPLVGRAPHLAALAEAFAAAQNRTVICYVHGRSGMGKSALVKHFLDDLETRGALILAGRCYEQEAVPYKALDSLMDSLSRHLRALPSDESRPLWPPDLRALARVFPVLGEAEGHAPPRRGEATETDRQELRRRAGNALRELLTRLGGRRPVVLAIDDLQWGDADSATLLAELLRPPDSPALLLVACYRSEDTATSPCLRLLLSPEGSPEEAPSRRLLAVEPLSESDARDLALALLGGGAGNATQAERIGRESGGNPYFVQVLAQRPGAAGEHQPGGEFTLDGVLREWMGALPEGARRLLDVVAISGQPLARRDAVEAAQLGTDAQLTLTALRHARLIRSSTPADDEEIETYHDRIRESALGHLPATARRDTHRRLGLALEAGSERPDSKRVFRLARHFDAAGESARALPYALAAAEQAHSQHALQVAEDLYRVAERGLARADEPTRSRVAEGLGEVLLLAGHYEEAGRQFHSARTLARRDVDWARIEGKRGHLAFERGDLASAIDILGGALRRLGKSVPRHSLGFSAGVFWEALVQTLHTCFPSLFLARRGLADGEADLCASRFYSRLTYVYWFHGGPVRCLWAHLRHLNLAECYPPTRELAQAYSEHGPIMALLGKFRRASAYAEKALAIHQRRDDRWGQGQALHFHGVVLYVASRFEEAIAKCRQAEALLEQTGDPWEVNSARYHAAASRYRLGDLRGALVEVRRYHQGAMALGTTTTSGWALGLWALASGGQVPPELLEDELRRRSDDLLRMAQVLLAEALCLLRAGRPLQAAEVLGRAARLVENAGVRNYYVALLWPWLATALRRAAEAPDCPAGHGRILLRRARQAFRRGLRLARRFANDLPHALREGALLAALAGKPRRARKLFAESLAVAARQSARYEHAQTLLALGQTGQRFGWPEAAEGLVAARQALHALEEGT